MSTAASSPGNRAPLPVHSIPNHVAQEATTLCEKLRRLFCCCCPYLKESSAPRTNFSQNASPRNRGNWEISSRPPGTRRPQQVTTAFVRKHNITLPNFAPVETNNRPSVVFSHATEFVALEAATAFVREHNITLPNFAPAEINNRPSIVFPHATEFVTLEEAEAFVREHNITLPNFAADAIEIPVEGSNNAYTNPLAPSEEMKGTTVAHLMGLPGN